MTQLNLIYPNGKMNIDLDVFLDSCGIMKFRKLLKIIKMTREPQKHIDTLTTFINDFLSISDELVDANVLLAKNTMISINNKEEQLKNLIHKRNIVKQQMKKILTYTTYRSQEYKLTKESEEELKEEIKKVRDQLVIERVKYRSYVDDVKRYTRNYKNYCKYLELLKEV
jgi:formyltetrahydrofolate synthetase